MTEKRIQRARVLRSNMTDAETHFWHHVRDRRFNNLKFKRQQPFPPYTVDFFCEEHALVIEIDGGQHSEQADAPRDAFLKTKGLTVFHYWNNDVLKNIEGILSDIKKHTGPAEDPSPKPSPDGRGLKRILIGKVATAHGIKGDVKVLCYANDPDLLFRAEGVYTDETTQKRVVLSFKSEPKANLFIATIKGMTDRNEAEKMRGQLFYIERDELPEAEDGEIYHSDMAGLEVVSAEGKAMGTVIRVQNFGAGDLLEIKGKKEAYYLPFAVPYLISIDMDARRVVMAEPEVF